MRELHNGEDLARERRRTQEFPLEAVRLVPSSQKSKEPHYEEPTTGTVPATRGTGTLRATARRVIRGTSNLPTQNFGRARSSGKHTRAR